MTCPVAHGGVKMTGFCPVSRMGEPAGSGSEENMFMGGCPVSSKGGLDMNVFIEGQTKPIPVTNIPADLSVAEFRSLMSMAAIKLRDGKCWDDVELFLEQSYLFPLPNTISLKTAGMKKGTEIYVNYKQDDLDNPDVRVVVPGRSSPLHVKELPSYANIGGLKRVLRSILDDTEFNPSIQKMRIKKFGSPEKLPEDFMLNRLRKDEMLEVEFRSANSHVTKSSTSNRSNTKKNEFYLEKSSFITILILIIVAIAASVNSNHLIDLIS